MTSFFLPCRSDQHDERVAPAFGSDLDLNIDERSVLQEGDQFLFIKTEMDVAQFFANPLLFMCAQFLQQQSTTRLQDTVRFFESG